jgi:NAD(P)-dependent dehydrogenase (short-subunit alcohol dehydrogenase family)
MQIDFAGKTVLVAGGTGGLGKSVSLAFLSEGARVIVTYRHEDGFKRLKAAAGSQAELLEGVAADVTDSSDVLGLVDRMTDRYGALDVVVNTIGGYTGGVKLWEISPDELQNMLDLNLRAGFVLAQATLPVLLKRGRGVFINVASKAAFDHAAGATAYAASKAAAVAMMDCLAADVKGTGVRVNTILPSIIDTEPNRKAMPDADFARWPKPEEIAHVILFLASDSAKAIHGASLPVYGDS